MNHVEVAKLGLALLERVELKGKEVSAFVSVNQLLGKIQDGTLVVLTKEQLQGMSGAEAPSGERARILAPQGETQ